MRNLIKKILREDFDWTEMAKPIELGAFEEDDVSYDDKGAKVYLGEEGKVTYNLSTDELIEYAYDGYDDWVLESLISSNGDMSSDYYDDGYIDDDEINYLGSYIPENQIERLQKILNHYRIDKNVKETITGQVFSELENPLLGIYRGRYDWEDFTNESISSLGRAINSNRWRAVGDYYLKMLSDNKVDIVSPWHGEVEVVMDFPYKNNNNLSEALADIGLDDYSWQDGFYEEWDSTGAEEEINWAFNQMLDKIEEQIDEETD
jgi:hypothetical protein